MIENKKIPFYETNYYKLSEEKKQKIINKFGKDIYNKYLKRQKKRIETISITEQSKLKKECHTLAKWMDPEDFKKDLQEIKEILTKQKENFWMQYGVLLCNHRDGEFFFSDHDIDIAMPLNISSNNERKWKEILYNRFKIFGDNGFELELYTRKRFFGQRIAIRKRVVTDIFLYDVWKDHYVFSGFKEFNDYQAWPIEMFDNLEDVDFNGVMFPAPKEIEKCLELDYGHDWKKYDSGKYPLNVAVIPKEEYKKFFKQKIEWRIGNAEEMVTINDMNKEYNMTVEDLQK